MKSSPLIFLLLVAAQLTANAQTSATLPPYAGPPGVNGAPPDVSTHLPSFSEDWSWFTSRQRSLAAKQVVDNADSGSLRLNYYYAMTGVPKNKAYAAERVTDITRIMRGSVSKRHETAMYYFSGTGRSRHAYKTADGRERILILDPRNQLGYLVRPDFEDVLRISGTPRNPIGALGPQGAARPTTFTKQVTTHLGVKEFDGLQASGSTTESAYPPGAAGNENDMVETREAWWIPQLGLTVYWRARSPVSGETIIQFRDIKLGEPPASVFEIPPQFKLRDVAAAAAPPAR